MKKLTMLTFSLFCFCLTAFSVMAAGNAEKGKALFNDAKLGTSGKTCNSCHNEGKGLDKSGEKKEISLMGKKYTSLEDAINFCIENPLKGKALDPKSQEMQDLVAYIKSLKK
jgi:cytochrome c